MKKIVTTLLIASLCMSSLCACSKKKEEGSSNMSETSATVNDSNTDPSEDVPVLGGYMMNGDLLAMNDASFDQAVSSYDGMSFVPLQALGTQVVAGKNTRYLAYGTPSTENASTSLKIVTVYQDLENNSSILNVADFHLADYLQDQAASGENELIAGGWTVNSELPNMLDDQTNAYFTKMAGELTGMAYEPVCVLGTQVVAGTNYAVLAKGTVVVPDATPNLYVVIMYVDLEGNATLTSSCVIDLASFS